jgi:filamentous hemagglutinin
MLCAALSSGTVYSADFFWLGQTNASWGNANWASNATGTPSLLNPGALDNVIFAATGAANQAASTLPGNLTINSLTVNSATGIGGAAFSELTLTNGGSINSALTLTNNITLLSSNALTIAAAGSLNVSASADFYTDGTVTVNGTLTNAGEMGGNGTFTMANNVSLINNGFLAVESLLPGASALTLNTSGTGAVVMGAGSSLALDLFTNAGDNTAIATAADRVNLNGTLDMTAGGEILLENSGVPPFLAAGDKWKLFNLGAGAQITGTAVVNDTMIMLLPTKVGSFTKADGVYTIRETNVAAFSVAAGETITINRLLSVVDNAAETFTNAGTVVVRDGFLNISNTGTGFTNRGTLAILAPGGGAFATNPVLTNWGSLTNVAGATLTNGNRLDNNSGATLTNSGSLTNALAADFTNYGTLANAAGGTLTNEGLLRNNGTLTNAATATLTNNNLLIINAGSTVTNNGILTNNGTLWNSSTITSAAGSTFNNAGLLTADNGTTLSLGANANLSNTGFIEIGFPGTAAAATISTSGTGAVVMGVGSELWFDLFGNAGDNTANPAAADRINLNGKIDATAGGTLRLGDALGGPAPFAANSSWKLVNLGVGASMTGRLTVDDSLPLLAARFSSNDQVGSFDRTTGNYSILQLVVGANPITADQSVSIGRLGVTINNGVIVTNAGLVSVLGGASATLAAGSSFTNNATAAILAGGTLNNNGTLANAAGSSLTNSGTVTNSLTLTNAATATLANNGTLTNAAAATLTNSGALTNAAAATLSNSGTLTNAVAATLTNSGALTNAAAATLTNRGVLTNAAAATLTNNGTLTNAATGTMVNNGALLGNAAITNAGTLSGAGTVTMANNINLANNGVISVGDSSLALPVPSTLTFTTSGTGAVVMGANSAIRADLYTGAGLVDNTTNLAAADRLVLTAGSRLDASAGGSLEIGNPNGMTVSGGDKWNVATLGAGAQITGDFNRDGRLNTTALNLTPTQVGNFNTTTGDLTIIDVKGGLDQAAATNHSVMASMQGMMGELNGRLFMLRASRDAQYEGTLADTMDSGVTLGEGDGPGKNPVARQMPASTSWEAYTMVNYANISLGNIQGQAGVDSETWAPGVGIEKRLDTKLTIGFAASMLETNQTFTGGLGSMDITGIAFSAYGSYVTSEFWADVLYSLGSFDLDSTRNATGFPVANGSTTATTNMLQFNAGYTHRDAEYGFVYGPFVGVDWMRMNVDSYSETGGGIGALAYADRTADSLVARAGYSFSSTFATSFAKITPQIRIAYERQNIQSSSTAVSLINQPFSVSSNGQAPGADYMLVGAGVNFAFTHNFGLLLSYTGQFLRENMSAHFGAVRFNYRF